MTSRPSTLARIASLSLALAAVLALVACTTVSLPPMGPGPPPLVGAKKTRTLGPAPIKGETATFAFATVNGVPAEMRFRLEDSLKQFATTRNLVLVPEGDPTAVYHVKGYLSAVGDTSGTLLVYTWDVTDASGAPLLRISGQETANGSDADPWIGVGSAQIDAAARETIDKLADWVRG
ncbi:MAG TPA: hypothetical protein VHA70_15985 [Bauldia sp.]|nr:hypothetical protein [Bauldia sp.]